MAHSSLPPSPSPAASSPPPARITSLDGLRGLAIGLVLLHHYIQLRLPSGRPWAENLDLALHLSWSGVDLFFVLSGFLIGGVLMDHRLSPRLALVFYVRRSLRIIPLYAVTLLVLFGSLKMGDYSHLPAWVYATFTSNFGMVWISSWDHPALAVMWSLAVEEQFYLFAPWLFLWLRPARIPAALALIVGLAWALRITALAADPSGFASHVLMPCRMDAFALGMLAAWAMRSAAARAWLARRTIRWWLPFAVLTPALLVLTFTRAPHGNWALSLYGYPTLALFFGWSVYVAVVIRPAALISVLEWAPLVNFGRLSYFIYLWHVVVLNVVIWRLLRTRDAVFLDGFPFLGAIAVAVAVTWALAAVSWKLFEGPLVRLGQRLRY